MWDNMKTKECEHEMVYTETGKAQCLICGMKACMFEIVELQKPPRPWTFLRIWELLGDVKGWEMDGFMDKVTHQEEQVSFFLEHDCLCLHRASGCELLYTANFFAWWAFTWRCRKIRKHLEGGS